MYRFAVVLLLIAAVSWPARAQRATGSVAGSVVDSTQAPVPGAKVVVRNVATGVERSTVSNEVGFYAVTALPAGPYTVSVSRERREDCSLV